MVEFEKIYTQYYFYVYKYVLSLCRNESIADEITQDTFVKALASLGRFNGKCKIQVWLCQIAKNTFLTYRTKSNRQSSSLDKYVRGASENIEQAIIDKEEAKEIHKVLQTLDEPYKEVFSLRIFGELSYAQIAELFNKTESWARVTYHRAKLKIKEALS